LDNTGAWGFAETTLTVSGSSSPPPLPPPPSNQPPIVSLTAPANGATFTAPASMTVSATASDVDGTIAQVDFYANGSFLRTDTSNPYSFSWTNVVAGDYSITAVARDNAGTTTVSSTRDISVRPANLPNTAVFVPSSNHATAVDRYVLDVFPVGVDPTVSNAVATRDLGKPAITNGEITVDVSSTILSLAPGTYIATVTAVGSDGSAQSAPSPAFSR
jgi:Big-like domain-containing protein